MNWGVPHAFQWQALTLGVVTFYVDADEFASFRQTRTYNWASSNRLPTTASRWLQLLPTDLFGGPNLQYLGRYDLTLELNGMFVDGESFGSDPELQMLALRTMAKSGVPWPLFHRDGWVLGFFAILSIEQGTEQKSGKRRVVTTTDTNGNSTTQEIEESGLGPKLTTNFTITFQRYSLGF